MTGLIRHFSGAALAAGENFIFRAVQISRSVVIGWQVMI
jgi:hypothetical protein